MNNLIVIISIFVVSLRFIGSDVYCNGVQTVERARFLKNWNTAPIATTNTWTLQSRRPMIDEDYEDESRKKKFKVKKKLKKFMLPLLLAYKLKFMTLIPVMIGGLLLLVGATGLAGFFFALFAAVMGLKSGGSH